jgi:XTP/dITP diphosphohydrolase
MDVILATRNLTKAEEVKGIFDGSRIRVIPLSETQVEGEAHEEEGVELFEANALSKALYVRDQLPRSIIMADDSGICIDALDGTPGANTAYWAGRHASTDEITRYALEQMEPHDNRGASFITCVVLLVPGKPRMTFAGAMRGTLLREPKAPAKPNMPFSSIFVPEGQDKCFAEMTVDEVNAISHRAAAFQKAREVLEAQLVHG